VSKDILASNFFELFELPVSFDVDQALMQQRYMQLQKQLHPDRFASSSDQEKRLSMQHTSWVNEALATLKDPVARASYLLKLKAIDVKPDNETTMDAAFLMQQLEMREKLEHVRQNFRNMNDDPLDELDSMSREIKASTSEIEQGFANSYEADELDEAREWVRKLQFMQKAKQEIDALTARIEDELM
jgi:molecular chaperone HscB